MHEESKIREAWYFLQQMHNANRDPNAFTHNLSTFLSAARSALQYAHDECTGGPSQSWYDRQVSASSCPLIEYFKDVRNLNIHVEPVAPTAVITVAAETTLHMTGSANYRLNFTDMDGNPVEIKTAPPVQPTPQPMAGTTEVTHRFAFADRPDDDILNVCESYIKEVEAMVKDGQANSHLTP